VQAGIVTNVTKMPGVEAERVSSDDTKIGWLPYFQESTKNAWTTHHEQHDLEDKALALAVNGVKDALELAVSSVRDDQKAMRELFESELRRFEAELKALVGVVESYDREARSRAEARRQHIEKDALLWREAHRQLHTVLDSTLSERLSSLGNKADSYDGESRARWDNHYKSHETSAQRDREAVSGLKDLQEEKQRAHEQIHAASQRAIDIADKSMTDKLAEMNQLRQQITAERGTYVNRDMLDSRLATTSEQTTSLSKTNDARIASLERSQNVAYGIMLVLIFAIPLGLRFIPSP